MYIKQGFNPKEGAQLVTDIHNAAVNYTKSTGAGLEVEHAWFMYSRFVQNNVQMKKAMEIEKEDLRSRRRVGKIWQKRNVFDGIVSTLTGLVTAEQLKSEQEAEKAFELKVARMLSHQVDAEKSLDLMSREFMGNVNQSNLEFKKIHHAMFRDTIYSSRVVGECAMLSKNGCITGAKGGAYFDHRHLRTSI